MTREYNLVRWLILFTSGFLLTGLMGCCCGGGGSSEPPPAKSVPLRTPTVSVRPGHAAIRKIAVLPFKASNELLGSAVADLFVTEFLGSDRYELVERNQIGKVLGESELAMAGVSDSQAAEVGSMIGADGVVVGTIVEYGTMTMNESTYAVVSMSARLIDSSNGRIVWSVDYAERADDTNLIPSELARMVVHRMVAEVNKALGPAQRAAY